MRMLPYKFLLSLFVFLMLCTPVLAQNRAIQGKVTDKEGQPVADAQITIYGIDNPRELKTKTGKDGTYLYLLGMNPGLYRVVVRKEGFQPMKTENVKPEMGDTVDVNFELTPGPDKKFPFEMTDEERNKYMEQYEAQEKQKQFSAAVRKHFDTGVELFDAGQYEEAVVEFNEAAKLDAEQPSIYSRLGDCYKRLNKYEDALASYNKSIELDPTNPNIYSNKGDVLSSLGRQEEALEAFKKAAEMNTGAGGALNYYNMGVTYYNNGDMEQAATFFRKAIEVDKNYAEAYYLLATCLSGNMDTIPEAVNYFKQYLDLGGKPENMEIAKAMVEALQDYAK